MTTAELKAIFAADRAFFVGLADVQEAILYGSALTEGELTEDADLLIVPAREMTEGEKVDLRQVVWERFKGKLPVMLEVVTPSDELSKASLAAKGVPMEAVFSR